MDIQWRNTQKPARFFMLDARAVIALLLFLVHARLWTLVVAGIFMVLFWILEQRGLTFDSSLRAFRSWILGSRRPANQRRSIRRWIDYG